MNHLATAITESAKLSMGYAQRLLTDVSADQFHRLAPGANGPVASNHPAFVYGHLSLYAARMVADVGGDAAAIEPTQAFLDAFNHGVACVDDPEGSIYPPMEVITERFFTSYETAITMVATIDDAIYAAPNPNEAMRERFSSMASMHAFYLGGHMMIHMGQISAWRRMMGLPPA